MLIVIKLIVAFDPAPLLRAGIILTQLLLVRQVGEGRQRWLGAFIVDLRCLTVLELFQPCVSASLIQVKRGSLIQLARLLGEERSWIRHVF